MGTARLGFQQPIRVPLNSGNYEFAFPPQIDPARLDLRIGDTIRNIRVEPTLRPELTAVVAQVNLPDYLGLRNLRKQDVRGGRIALVKGSRATFSATASRDLGSAEVDGKASQPKGSTISTATTSVDGPRKIEFRWRDTLGLSGKEPFVLDVDAKDDEPPSLACEDLPRQKVLLDLEQLAFKVHAQDDFGIKRIGLEWKGLDETGATVKTTAKGEKILAAGGHDQDAMEVEGTFSAKALGIEPQPIVVRVFAEDYLPGRPRVYSPPYTFYVLNSEQHAIWLTEQLSKWHRQALEVRDREMQLGEANKQIRDLPADQLDTPETRRRIENQALAERANGRRLSGLVMSGEDLVRQATRNPEFGVGHLEKWAEMLQILKDISGNRMPSVADLLKEAASSPALASSANAPKTRQAGNVRTTKTAAGGSEPKKSNPNKSAVPTVADMESSQNSPDDPTKAGKPSSSKPKDPRLTLPKTTVMGKATEPKESPAAQKVDEAVRKQQDLLAEFDKIADELNRVLANLEGSTLVKRLKAASRLQYKVAGKLGDMLSDTFGVSAPLVASSSSKVLTELTNQEAKGSHDISLIMDDMQAYFERRRFMKFKTVLDEMRKLDPIGSIRQIGDDLRNENGLSIAQCEYWSDTLDRWAEDLVDPACKGSCPGSKSKSSLPPSIVLEAMLILEGEVNLREETRVAQQARPALETAEFNKRGKGLSENQNGLRDRTDKLVERIRELPDAESEFGYEINLLGKVSDVMDEATGILATPETGSTAIAAETEAIELLLQSKRINPKAGGGGGSSPGGGGTGTTSDAAIALLGNGVNEKEVREDHGVSQSTGESGPTLPEEYRSGLDEYFNRLEREPSTH
jgi:hypothetical protein